MYLEYLVREHHILYMQYFGRLMPKHHFLIHYSLLLRLNGPIIHLSALKCERNHRRGKRYARVSQSRVQLALSVAIKHQLYLCERLMRPDSLRKPIHVTNPREVLRNSLNHFDNFSKTFPFPGGIPVQLVNSVDVQGTFYSCGMILVVRSDSILPTFGKIVHCVVRDDDVLFVVNLLNTFNYNSHVCSYVVECCSEYICCLQSELKYYIPLWQRFVCNQQMVSLKHLL